MSTLHNIPAVSPDEQQWLIEELKKFIESGVLISVMTIRGVVQGQVVRAERHGIVMLEVDGDLQHVPRSYITGMFQHTDQSYEEAAAEAQVVLDTNKAIQRGVPINGPGDVKFVPIFLNEGARGHETEIMARVIQQFKANGLGTVKHLGLVTDEH